MDGDARERGMRISEILPVEAVRVDVPCPDKRSALRRLIAQAAERVPIDEREACEVIAHRERLGSTGIGGGVAVPHARLKALDAPVACLARLQQPVAFDAPDAMPVDIVFLLLSPDEPSSMQLRTLANVTSLLRKPRVLDGLRAASDPEALVRILQGAEAA